MGWFSKKEVSKPSDDLPELPDFPEFPSVLNQNNSLANIDNSPRPSNYEIKDINSSFENQMSNKMPVQIKTEEENIPKVIPQDSNPSELKKSFYSSSSETTLSPPPIPLVLKREAPVYDTNVIKQSAIIETKPIPQQLNQVNNKDIPKKEESIYIRLDKFETTLESFESIKDKLKEIDDLLLKSREIKQKEEEELSIWEKEIQSIKSRLDYIDKNLFDQLN